MAGECFNVVFTGNLAEGEDIAHVRKKLAAAFRIDETKMAQLFRLEGGVVRRNVDLETAEKYLAFLEQHGAICRIEEVIEFPPAPPPLPPEATEERPSESAPRVVKLKPMGAKLQFSPLRISRLTAAEGGVDLNRADLGQVPFEDILALTAIKDTQTGGKTILLLFVRNAKRPYAVEATQVAFGDFPQVKGGSTELSLSNLIAFMLENNPAIVRDTDTEQFVESGGYGLKEAELTVHATALAAVMDQGSA